MSIWASWVVLLRCRGEFTATCERIIENQNSLGQGDFVNLSSLFGPRIIAERKRLKLSQEAAGSACGVSREMWGKYERGQATMGTEVLAGFAAAGADALYILTGQHAAPSAAPALSREEAALLDNFRACSPKEQAAIKAASAALAQHPDDSARSA